MIHDHDFIKQNDSSYIANIIKLAALTFAIFTLNGCTSSEESSPKIGKVLAEQTEQDGRACIRVSRIRGYGVDDGVISINAGRKYYLATTLYNCDSLDFAPRALFDATFSEACGGSSFIVTRDERCPIEYIFEFEKRADAHEALNIAEEKLKTIKAEASNSSY